MSEKLEQQVRERAGGRCEYCLTPVDFSPDPFEIDHFYPKSLGGLYEIANLVLSCSGCNGHKHAATHAIDFASGEPAKLYNPRLDDWHEHFRWDENYELLHGISPTGRATVAKLHLNRKGVVNLRRVLREAGEHPPF